jgi:hypothetical protein
MNASAKRIRRSPMKPIVLALAFGLPTATVLAEDMSNVVTARADQAVDQQYGRDSVYAFSPRSKPFTPDQTGSRSAGGLESVKSYAANTWHKTTDWFGRQSAATSPPEPQRYGRAGGYVGAEQIAYVETHATPAPGEAIDTVKTGAADTISSRPVPETTAQAESMGDVPAVVPSAEQPTATSPDTHGRTEGDRFDNPESRIGQDENSLDQGTR